MRKGNKTVIIAVLLFVVLGMGVGYSILSKQLKIEGTATIENDLNVEIVSIRTGEQAGYYGVEQCFNTTTVDYCEATSGGTVIQNTQPSFTSTTANFDVTLGVNSVARYVVTLKNTGSLAAEINNVTINKTGSTAIVLTTPRDVKGYFLNPGETVDYFVELSYSANSEVFDSELTSNVSVTFDIIQKLSGYEGEHNPAFIYFGEVLVGENNTFIEIIADSNNRTFLNDAAVFSAGHDSEGNVDAEDFDTVIEKLSFRQYSFAYSGIGRGRSFKLINGDEESNIIKLTHGN